MVVEKVGRKLRIALCSAGELYGGVEQFIYLYAQHLQASGQAGVVVILFHRGKLSKRLEDADIETHVVHSRFKYDPRVVTVLARIFRRRRIDVVHTNGYKANTLCAVAARRAGAVVVKTEHGLVETALRPNKSALKSYFNRALDQLVTLALTNHVVYVTHDLAGRFRLIHRSKNRTVIHNAIAPIDSRRTGIAEAFDRNRFNVGIVGRVDEVKGHVFLLKAVEALAGLHDLQVHVIGNGPLEARLREFCLAHRLEPKVRFWGFREDIHELMRGLDVLVMPSLHEGLPYTLLEAMYLRIPVIASAVGGLREVLRDKENALLVAPANYQELANAMRRFHDDRELRERLARRAFADVTSRFMIADMAQKYAKVYGSALDSARRS